MNSNPPSLTHVRDGKPTMVDVADKPSTRRSAVAEAVVELGAGIMERLSNNDIQGPKGPVFQTAIIAGTMAVKQTSALIPFCHPLPIEACEIRIEAAGTGVTIRCKVTTTGKTGVEMEAMTGATVAALAVYDMTKAMNKGIVIQAVRLLEKSGGKSGDYHCAP
ncbi:MAG: cyclic pyranopterin monophosphate synthase MoaC [Verrucomicrobiota bacterium]